MIRILVVDDDENTVRMLSTALELLGHKALPATSGEEALLLIERERPDLLLLDYMMPEMDGIETLQQIRGTPKGSSLPVIMITAFPGDNLKKKAYELGIVAFFEKPLHLDRLEQLLLSFHETKILR